MGTRDGMWTEIEGKFLNKDEARGMSILPQVPIDIPKYNMDFKLNIL